MNEEIDIDDDDLQRVVKALRERAYIKKKDYKAATEWANKAIQADAKLGAAYVNRGIAKQMLKDEDGACADWKKAAEYGIAEGKRYKSGFCD